MAKYTWQPYIQGVYKTFIFGKCALPDPCQRRGRRRHRPLGVGEHTRVSAVCSPPISAALSSTLRLWQGSTDDQKAGWHRAPRLWNKVQEEACTPRRRERPAGRRAIVGLSAPQPASAARRAPATKPAGQPNARRREVSTDPQAVRTRKKVRKWRTKTGGQAPTSAAAARPTPKAVRKRRADAAAADAVPELTGSTASGRQAAFASEDRSDEAARQAVERDVRNTLKVALRHSRTSQPRTGRCTVPSTPPPTHRRGRSGATSSRTRRGRATTTCAAMRNCRRAPPRSAAGPAASLAASRSLPSHR